MSIQMQFPFSMNFIMVSRALVLSSTATGNLPQPPPPLNNTDHAHPVHPPLLNQHSLVTSAAIGATSCSSNHVFLRRSNYSTEVPY